MPASLLDLINNALLSGIVLLILTQALQAFNEGRRNKNVKELIKRDIDFILEAVKRYHEYPLSVKESENIKTSKDLVLQLSVVGELLNRFPRLNSRIYESQLSNIVTALSALEQQNVQDFYYQVELLMEAHDYAYSRLSKDPLQVDELQELRTVAGGFERILNDINKLSNPLVSKYRLEIFQKYLPMFRLKRETVRIDSSKDQSR